MLFRRLVQRSAVSLLSTAEGYLVSGVAHAALAALLLSPTPRKPFEELPESFQWAKFLVPKEKPTGSVPVRERITFMTTAQPGGEGTLVDDSRDASRLEIEVTPGTQTQDVAEVAVAPAPSPDLPGDEVLTVLEVDSAAVRVEDSAAPPYPPNLLARRLEGTVAVQYIVDTTGRADTSSFFVLSTTHADFATSVRNTLPLMRFNPAYMGQTKVRQLVQQQFSFKIDTLVLQAEVARKKPSAQDH